MSRGYDARRKARQRQAQSAAQTSQRGRSPRSRRLMTLIPVLAIAAILAATAALGFSLTSGGNKEIKQEVTELLAGIPQEGTALGSPKAPVTLRVFADLQCPTVKRFVEKYLPSIIDKWVRPGLVRLEYRSFQTDTSNESTFFRQEIAALAAGRQDKMWNFALTFVRQQETPRTGYATDEFLTGIAEQVPGLEWARWRQDREAPVLLEKVALGIHRAQVKDLEGTPSFLLGFQSGQSDQHLNLTDKDSIKEEVEADLGEDIRSLLEEASEDVPTIGAIGAR